MHEEASVSEPARGLYMMAVEAKASLSVSAVTKEMNTEGLRCCAVIHILKESGRKLWREGEGQMLWCIKHYF